MRYKFHIIWFCIIAVVLGGCVGSPSKSKAKGDLGAQVAPSPAAANPRFVMPVVPSKIKAQDKIIDYTIEHYWDSFDFEDPRYTSDEEFVRELFNGYIELLESCPRQNVLKKSISKVVTSALAAGEQPSELFMWLYELYLYNPNSPYACEELYITYLELLIDNKKLGASYKIRPEAHLAMAQNNRLNTQSIDFEYTLRDGTVASMHDIRANYLILYFNNPDCHDCTRVKNYFESSEVFGSLNQSGELKILSIYPDPTLDVWLRASYPDIMIDSYDKGQVITEEKLYDLKAIPTLYLLDEQKRVLLKDASVETIEAELRTLLF